MSFVLKIGLWLLAISALRHWWRQAFPAAAVSKSHSRATPEQSNDNVIAADYRVLKRDIKDE